MLSNNYYYRFSKTKNSSSRRGRSTLLMPWTPPLQPPPSAPLTAGAVSSFLWKIAVYLEEEVASNELPEIQPSLITDSNAATSAGDISSLLNAPSISPEQMSDLLSLTNKLVKHLVPEANETHNAIIKEAAKKLKKSAAQSSFSA
ncbi:hypothetical protein GEMRC1_000023 [Eukaryota sp. GEM-RC1]